MQEVHASDAPAYAIMNFVCDMQIQIAASNGIKDFTNSNLMCLKRHPGFSVSVNRGLKCAARHIEFGVYLDNWFIETLVPYPESIPYMSDRFWSDIGEIAKVGKTSFEENVPNNFPKATPKRFVHARKSVVFRLIRNVIFKGLDADGDQENLGFLCTKVPITTKFSTLVDQLRHTYGLYYRCVSQLHKHATQRDK